jgi:hypothetical protein
MMASSKCVDSVDMMRRDPRLRLLPLGARALFVLLVDALEQMPEHVFCLGNRPGSIEELASLVAAPQTEVETHLETLLHMNLLTRRATDGALTLPGTPTVDHATVARENGGLGGRPRKGETCEEARARRSQGNLKLVIVGGNSETQETQEKPSGVNASRVRVTTTTLPRELAKQSVEVEKFAIEMAKVAGLKSGTLNAGPIAEWLAAGIGEQVIRETIAKVARRQGYAAAKVHSLRYFDRAIHEAHAMQPKPNDPVSKDLADRWEIWISGGRCGPMPRQAA